MKKEIKISILILIGFISLLWLEKPFRDFLNTLFIDDLVAELISTISIRSILIVIIFFLIKQLRLMDFNGFNFFGYFKYSHAILISIVFVLCGISINWETYANSKISLLILFAISTLTVGIVEEFVFRGTIFPLLFKSFTNNARPILISAVLSSLMFGIIHFFNLIRHPENFIGITSQVIFATSIGVFFCGLMVRTENILIPSIIHALINFSFGAGDLIVKSEFDEVTVKSWFSLVLTIIYSSLIFILGINMILKTDKSLIFVKLNRT